MKVLKKKSKEYKENLANLLKNRWLDKKHIKHSRIVVAHWESIVCQSDVGYNCVICQEVGASHNIQNKRKSSRVGWDDVYGTSHCGSCNKEVSKFFPAKKEYCK